MKRKPTRSDDEDFEPAFIAGTGVVWTGPTYRKNVKVKDIRVFGFVRPGKKAVSGQRSAVRKNK